MFDGDLNGGSSIHAVNIGGMPTNRDPQPPEPGDEAHVPVNVVLAAHNALARIDKLLTDPEHQEAVVQRLYGLGATTSNDHLPATDSHSAAPTVVDVDSASAYLKAIRKRLLDANTFLEALGNQR